MIFQDYLKGRNVNLAYLYHIAGSPWAVCSRPELVTNMTTAYRRKLFGATYYGDFYPADNVVLLPGLDPDIGGYSVQYTESGGLSADSWTVSFQRQAGPADFSKHYASGRQGLLGLDIRPVIDAANVYRARLTSSYPASASSVIRYASNALMDAWIDAQIAATNYPYVWLRNQCLMISSRSTSGTDSVCAVQNILKTKKSYVPKPMQGLDQVLVGSVPLNGFVGFNSYLYAIELTESGTIAEPDKEPIILRSGRVLTNAVSNAADWKITNSSWLSLLEQELPVSTFEGTLQGISLTRPNDDAKVGIDSFLDTPHAWRCCAPHLILVEDYDSPAPDPTDTELAAWPHECVIWLCAENDSVFFNTVEDLNTAVQDEIFKIKAGTSTLNSTETLYYDYAVVGGHLVYNRYVGGSIKNGQVVAGGRIPLICGWKWVAEEYKPHMDISPFMPTGYRPFRWWPWVLLGCVNYENYAPYQNSPNWHWFGGSYTWGGISYRLGEELPPWKDAKELICPEYACEYWYDWAIDDTTIDDEWKKCAGTIPLTTIDSEYRLYFKSEDVTDLLVDDILCFGDPAKLRDGFPIAVYGKVANVGTNSTRGMDYAEMVNAAPYALEEPSSGVPKLKTAMIAQGQTWPIRLGIPLWYRKDIHEDDPWKMHVYSEVFSQRPSDLFRALLGKTGDASVPAIPRQYTLDNIPDAVGQTGTFDRTLIDWDTFNQYTGGQIPGAFYRYLIGSSSSDDYGTNTLLDLLNAVLFTHRLQMAWQYNETQRAWWITFVEIGSDSITTAAREGRAITNDDLVMGKAAPITLGGTYLVGRIEYECVVIRVTPNGFIAGPNKAIVKSPYADVSKTAKTLKFNDIITVVQEESIPALNGNLATMLSRLMFVPNTQKLSCVTAALTKLAVGKEILLTSECILDTDTGVYGASELVGKVIAVDLDPVDPSATIRLCPKPTRAIAPSMYFSHTNAVLSTAGVITLTGLVTDPADNNFAPTTGGLTDLEMFDCLTYSPETGEVRAMTCSCGDYRVIVLKRKQSVHDATTYWRGSIGSIDGAAGTCEITLDDMTNFDDASGDYVVYFSEYDDQNLALHQKIWAFLCDEDGIATDYSGNSKITAVCT